MSLYVLSNSRRALDEAVRYGKMARREAEAAGFLETIPQYYFYILNNVGYALSYRSRHVKSATDLDEAIECAMEIRRLAWKDEMLYSSATINLISRLRVRYAMRRNLADLEEVTQLITEQFPVSTPGSTSHGIAIKNRGEMAAEKFSRTDAIEDLEKALDQMNVNAVMLPHENEDRFYIEYRISDLFGALRILTPSNHTHALRQGWEARNQALNFQDMIEKKEGPVYTTDGQQVDMVMLKQWLNNCDHNHGSVCNSYGGSDSR